MGFTEEQLDRVLVCRWLMWPDSPLALLPLTEMVADICGYNRDSQPLSARGVKSVATPLLRGRGWASGGWRSNSLMVMAVSRLNEKEFTA